MATTAKNKKRLGSTRKTTPIISKKALPSQKAKSSLPVEKTVSPVLKQKIQTAEGLKRQMAAMRKKGPESKRQK